MVRTPVGPPEDHERTAALTKPSLLTQIEDALLNGRPVADVLRQLIVLGGRVGSPELRGWATRELRGYDPRKPQDLPAYRKVSGILQLDAIVGFNQISGRQIAPEEIPEELPDDVRDSFSNEVPFHQGIGEIESLVTAKNGFVRLSPPAADSLARYMDRRNGVAHQQIQRIYWSVSVTSIRGIVDLVKTRLAELLGELREVTPDGGDTPTPAQAAQAVNIVLHGGRGHHLRIANAAEGAVASIEERSDDGTGQSGWWTLGRKIWSVAIGVATIAAAVIAYLQLSSTL